MESISCFIITKNEEKNISKAINSIKNIASEIIVVDSGSTDKTCQIAEAQGAKVIYNEWPGYLKQKIYAESLCKNDWVLNIDGDEEFTDKLQEEIIMVNSASLLKTYKAYIINFIILGRNEDKPRKYAPSNKYMRLYNIKHAGFNRNKGDSTHDDVKLDSNSNKQKDIFTFLNPALHRSNDSISQLVNKANFYSSEQAKDLDKKGRKVSSIRVALEFPLWFFKAYLIRRYFVFGFEGFVDSMIFAFRRFIRLAKLRELQNKDD